MSPAPEGIERGELILNDLHRSLFDRMMDGVYVSTHEGKFVEVNQAMVRMFGFIDKAEMLEVDIKQALYFAPSDRDSRFLDSGTEKVEVFRMRRKDGSEIWVEDHGSYIHNEAGEVQYHHGIIRDVTERVLQEERSQRVTKLKETLLRSARLPEKMKLITNGIVEIFGADFARIWIVYPGDICRTGCIHGPASSGSGACTNTSSCLHLISSSGRYTDIQGGHRRVPLGVFKIGRVASGLHEKFISNDVLSDPEVQDTEWARTLGLVSFAGYRLVSDDSAPIGVMALFGQHPISSEVQIMLEDLANTVSQIILNESASEALRESEDRYRTLFENANEAIFLMDENHFVECNSQTLSMFGCERGQILGETPVRFSPELQSDGRNSTEAALGFITLAMSGQPQHFEWRHLRYDGTPFEAEVRLNSLTVGGKVYLQALVRDITARKQAEERVRVSHAELQKALAEVKTLGGLIPICATCKKIRDDKGYWSQLEAYMHAHTDAQFTHGICPDCAQQYYNEMRSPKKTRP